MGMRGNGNAKGHSCTSLLWTSSSCRCRQRTEDWQQDTICIGILQHGVSHNKDHKIHLLVHERALSLGTHWPHIICLPVVDCWAGPMWWHHVEYSRTEGTSQSVVQSPATRAVIKPSVLIESTISIHSAVKIVNFAITKHRMRPLQYAQCNYNINFIKYFEAKLQYYVDAAYCYKHE